ncbi:hypothetical protein M23134_01203 [Microscilla marina ATCC 23134]|uniref:Uncharacterized protein n=1 Tax=Microscilla marina ATCC 23134 TaxID=313606 RepID=A1ZFV5_MICM2|nr:hypothetical protein M23134_01203 [Microscilla marina ATCC 23134]
MAKNTFALHFYNGYLPVKAESTSHKAFKATLIPVSVAFFMKYTLQTGFKVKKMVFLQNITL